MSHGNYRLPREYCIRRDNTHFLDVPTGLNYQPHVYELASYLARRAGAKYVVDIGCGSGAKLRQIQDEFDLLCVDCEPAIQIARSCLNRATFITADLEAGLPELPTDLLENAVVICADVIEHLRSPEQLAQGLAAIAAQCKYLLISTPDRTRARGFLDCGPPANPAHTMEWSADEFARFLRDCGWSDDFFIGHTINTDQHWNKTTTLIIAGRETRKPSNRHRVDVAAIIHTLNEADIIGEAIEHLVSQGVEVHVIDNWSTDGTFEIVQQLKCANIMRFPEAPTDQYQWHKQLEFSALYASQLDADWIIHHDADEFRYAPWRGVTLAEAISRVDELGYNAIDFTVLDFRFLADNPEPKAPYEQAMNWFEFGRRPGHFSQIKAWRNTKILVDLASSGGHDVAFPGRRVFPLKFLSKHYPLRGKSQAERKIFQDRLPRISKEQSERGWHTQYDAYNVADGVAGWFRHTLLPWHEPAFETEYLVERLSGVGLICDAGIRK